MKKTYLFIGGIILLVLISCAVVSYYFNYLNSFCLNLATEMIGIAFTVFIVEVLIHKHSELQDWGRDLHDDKQQMSKYLDLVKLELKLVIESLDNGVSYDFRDFRKLLTASPQFPSFKPERISSENHDATKNTYRLLNELEKYIEKGNINKSELNKFYISVLRRQFDILKITKGK